MKFISLILLLIFFPLSSFAQQGGYVNQYSTAKGDTIEFYISTSKNPFTLSIYKVEEEDKLITSIDSVKGGIQVVEDSSYYYGCRWAESLSFKIPDTWKPGAYRAVFPTTDSTAGIIFFVTEKQPGTYSKILFVSSTNTWNAYNFFGGKSIYGFNSTDGKESSKVSFLRPNWYPYGSLDFFSFERRAIQFLARNNIYPEFTSDTELDFKNDLLKNYDVVFIVGHSEYWTNQHRWQFQNYLSSGGKIIILAGATCWSQVRIEGHQMVKYRPAEADPLYGVVDSLVTTLYNGELLNWPENELIGGSGVYGGYINHNGRYPASQGFGDYAAYNTHHWVHEGTRLHEGDEYGFESLIAGNENDGAEFNWEDGIPVVTGANGTPLNYRLLSLSPAQHYRPALGIQGWATMGIFHNASGGAVFNAATIRWAWGLDKNPVVQRITKNVLDKFLDEKFPPDIVSWSPAIVDSKIINTKMHHLNRRDYLHKDASLSSLFLIDVEDPLNETVNYIWTENGKILSRAGRIDYSSDSLYKNGRRHSIKVYVYNSTDTSSITWNYYNSELAFSSDPVIWVEPGGNYFYKLSAFNYHEDELKFEIVDAPEWLQLDDTNTLSGNAPSTEDTFAVSIKVTNEHNQTDEQEFDLIVSNTFVKIDEILPPSEYSLEQNYPNPFNPVTRIIYNLPQSHSGPVSLKVYDILGNEVAVLVDEVQPAGSYEVNFDGNTLSSGIYLYSIKAQGFNKVNKMLLVK